MKRCPRCNRVESDETLAFCRVDGTALENNSISDSTEAGTAHLGTASAATEIATRILPVTGNVAANRGTGPTTLLQPQQATSASVAPPRRRRTTIAVVIVVCAAILAVGIALAVSFLITKKHALIQSIAVMPFVNQSGNADVEYLSDGMTETLIKSLSQLPNVNVKARSSVFRYKGKETNAQTIGKELNVQAILNGRVVQRGDQLTLSLELIDTQTENVIWTEQYNRRQTDLVTLQSEIARDVSSQLKTKLSGAETEKVTKTYTANPEAYQLYLKGRFHLNKRTYVDIQQAIEYFKAAVAIDDRFALAYSGLADCYSVLPYYVGSKSSEFTDQARPYAIRAVEIDDQLAEAHSSLAFVNEGSWNWVEAEKEYIRAIELNPNYSSAQIRYARFEVRVPGRDVEGLKRAKLAIELEPWSLVANDNLSQMYLSQGNVDLALEQAKRTVELDPAYSFGRVDLAYAYVKKGQHAEAIATAEKAVENAERATRTLVCLAVVDAMTGKGDDATSILNELKEKYPKHQSDATEVAAIYAGLGNKDEAFAWLEKAFQDHSSLLVDLRVEFPFAALRDDQRFKDLRSRMGMPN
jgi:TolB-like protein/Tfp pilus assembly protein PilF